MRTNWTHKRLNRLFERYRVLYWPRSRRLRTHGIQISPLEGACGRWDGEQRILHVDVSKHPSDREIRATLLHEMIHAVVGRAGHGAPFWEQLEFLLARRAPITVGFPELGERGNHLCVIPARFKRCRKLFAPIYRKHQREIEQLDAEEQILTIQGFEQECFDFALNGASWREIWQHQARTLGFIDLDGRILPDARRWHEAARRGYRGGRRFRLESERTRARFERLRSSSEKKHGHPRPRK